MFEYEVRYPTPKEFPVIVGAGLPGYPKQPSITGVLNIDGELAFGKAITENSPLLNIVKDGKIVGIAMRYIHNNNAGTNMKHTKAVTYIMPMKTFLKNYKVGKLKAHALQLENGYYAAKISYDTKDYIEARESFRATDAQMNMYYQKHTSKMYAVYDYDFAQKLSCPIVATGVADKIMQNELYCKICFVARQEHQKELLDILYSTAIPKDYGHYIYRDRAERYLGRDMLKYHAMMNVRNLTPIPTGVGGKINSKLKLIEFGDIEVPLKNLLTLPIYIHLDNFANEYTIEMFENTPLNINNIQAVINQHNRVVVNLKRV